MFLFRQQPVSLEYIYFFGFGFINGHDITFQLCWLHFVFAFISEPRLVTKFPVSLGIHCITDVLYFFVRFINIISVIVFKNQYKKLKEFHYHKSKWSH